MLSEHLHNQAVAPLPITPQAKAGLAPSRMRVSTPAEAEFLLRGLIFPGA